MRQGSVYVNNKLAGTIMEDENGYNFTYNQAYLRSKSPIPVSLTLLEKPH